jgi:hypothetical protein
MTYAENYRGGALVPFFALCLFAGIRPCVRTGEILKLQPDHVRLDTGVIHIEPEVSKVRMKRNVTIQPNLEAWLQAYPLDRFPIVVPALQKHRAKVAKLFGLSHDVMRHTFISFFVAKFRSMGEAALQAGNSETIIRKHYLDLKTPAEAEEFFGILPKRADSRRVGNGTQPFGADGRSLGMEAICRLFGVWFFLQTQYVEGFTHSQRSLLFAVASQLGLFLRAPNFWPQLVRIKLPMKCLKVLVFSPTRWMESVGRGDVHPFEIRRSKHGRRHWHLLE